MQTFIYPKFDQTAKAKIVEREKLFKSSKQKKRKDNLEKSFRKILKLTFNETSKNYGIKF